MSGSSSFSLNYPAVEEAVSSSNNLIENIDQLSENIRSYTNQIVSMSVEFLSTLFLV